MTEKVSFSVVVPVFNEAENLNLLYKEIASALDGQNFEIIFVNDGSEDGSFQVLKELHRQDARVKVINFRKNFGQTAAITAGFDYSSGDVVVTLDADLQNDPADIMMLVEKLLSNDYDIVNGWRKNRKDRALTRKLPSYLGNKLVSLFTGVRLHDYGCTLRAFRREVVKNLKLYGEMHRYIPAIASRMGIRSIEVPVNHRPRLYGKSKYGLSRTFRVLLDLISLKYLLSYSHKPLQIFGGSGLLMITGGFISGLVLVYEKYFLLQPISGRPLLFLTILLIFLGFQFISLGLIAEMLTRIYLEGLNRNPYNVREVIGFNRENLDDRSRAVL